MRLLVAFLVLVVGAAPGASAVSAEIASTGMADTGLGPVHVGLTQSPSGDRVSSAFAYGCEFGRGAGAVAAADEIAKSGNSLGRGESFGLGVEPGMPLRPAVELNAPHSAPLREIGRKGDPGATGLFIRTQKQQEHILGTANHANRVKQGGTPSVWNPGVNADGMTRHAWQNGTQVPGRPGVRDFDVGSPVGVGPGGGSQTTIRVHMDGKGQIHGHPVGPETP